MLCLVTQSCPTLCSPVDCSPPGCSVHEISQARIPEQVAISYSRGSSPPRDLTLVSYISCIGRRILYHPGTLPIIPDSLILPTLDEPLFLGQETALGLLLIMPYSVVHDINALL